jgi:tripartite-type tricarboxylate transporter receptor subunit TctC
MGFPVVAPPGVPTDRVVALRKAFQATMADPAFLDDARKRGLQIAPSPGEDVKEVVDALLATPKETIATLKRSLEDAKSEKLEK